MLNLGTVGTGYFSQFHYDGWSRIAEARLAAVCDRDGARARERADMHGAAAYATLAEMLSQEKLDLLDIIAPPPTHLEMIRQAAAHQVAVICQKPFCQTLDEAEEAVALCEDAGVLLVVHENFRFQPWHQKARDLIAPEGSWERSTRPGSACARATARGRLPTSTANPTSRRWNASSCTRPRSI